MKKILCTLFFSSLWALPQSPLVTHGTAEFSSEIEHSLHIQASDRAVVQWKEFSISSNETVVFSLPKNTSAVLNKVIDANPSRIFGRVASNGQVILVNPNGVLVGKEAIINTASFIASSFDILEVPFLEKNTLVFSGSSQRDIQVQGYILANSGEITLIGRSVEIQGKLESAEDTTLISLSDRNLATEGQTLYARSNLKIGTDDTIPFLFDQIVEDEDGPLLSGQTDFSGQIQSKNVTLLGDHIKLRDSSQILSNCGKVVIGGEKNDRFIAQSVVLATTSSIEGASDVSIWSELATIFHGSILTREKGSIEISGKRWMDFTGELQTFGGHLLIDPTNVTIGPGGDVNTSPGPVYVYSAPNVNIDNTLLSGILGGGTSVTIDTSQPNNQGQIGTMLVVGAVTWNSVASLTLISDRNMTVNADVFNSGGASTGPVSLLSRNGNVTISSIGQPSSVTVGAQRADVSVRAPRGSISCTADTAINHFVCIGSSTALGISTGDIFVEAGVNLDIIGGISTSHCWAGVTRQPPSPAAVVATGNITINVGNRFNLYGGGAIGFGNFSDAYVGSGSFAVGITTGDITIHVGHIFDMMSGPNDPAFVGSGSASGTIGNININVGEYMYMHTQSPFSGFAGAYIGGSIAPGAYRQNLFLNVGRNLTMDARDGGFTNFQIFNIFGNNSTQGVQRIHVGGDFVLIAGNSVAGQSNILNHFARYYSEIWVGGNIRCYNSFTNGAVVVRGFAFTTDSGEVNIQACGNIIQGDALDIGPGGFITSTSGNFLFRADALFAPGQLWPPQTTLINGINIFAGTPLGVNSINGSTVDPSVIGGNGRGGFNVDTGRYAMSTALFPSSVFGFVNTNNPAAPTPPAFNPGSIVGYQTLTINGGNLTFLSAAFYENGAADDLLIADASFPNSLNVFSDFGDIHVEGFRDINLTNIDNAGQTGYYQTFFDGSITTIAERNINLVNAHPYAVRNIDFVVDDAFPASPLIGPGFITMDATSSFESVAGYIRVYTALRPLNTIDPLAQFISAGVVYFFVPGTIYTDTCEEQWCTYYPTPNFTCPPSLPFSIFYKDCRFILVRQAGPIINEMLVDLHPYNEYPGWMMRYWMAYAKQLSGGHSSEPYMLGRRHFNIINHPKSWAQLIEDLHPSPIVD